MQCVKKENTLNLIKEMSRNYRCVKFVNLSISSLGVFSDECSTFLDMMNDIGIEKKQQYYILIKTLINIAIRATYYIFWNFDFWIIQSQAANCKFLYVATFTIVHLKRQIKFPLLVPLLSLLFRTMMLHHLINKPL